MSDTRQAEKTPGPKLPGQGKMMRSVRAFCLQCQGEMPTLVRSCADSGCAMFPFRLPGSEGATSLDGRAVRAVRRHCLVCAGSPAEVRGCDAADGCPLWPYRFGVLPATYQRVMNRIRAPRTLWLPGFEPQKN